MLLKWKVRVGLEIIKKGSKKTFSVGGKIEKTPTYGRYCGKCFQIVKDREKVRAVCNLEKNYYRGSYVEWKKTRGYDKAINFVLKKLCVLFGGKNLCFHFNGTNVKRKINGLNPQITRKCGWFSILTPNEWVHSKWKWTKETNFWEGTEKLIGLSIWWRKTWK